MSFKEEKDAIIEQLAHIDDERTLRAIKSLLDYESVDAGHKRLIEERLSFLEQNRESLIDWEDIKYEL
jgi:hypothetical protein